MGAEQTVHDLEAARAKLPPGAELIPPSAPGERAVVYLPVDTPHEVDLMPAEEVARLSREEKAKAAREAEAIPVVQLVRQRHGGALKTGGNGIPKGRARSQVARDLLEAASPALAKQLLRMARTGKNRQGKPMSVPDHIKTITAALDRGRVPPAKEIVGQDGEPLGISVTSAAPRTTVGGIPTVKKKKA